jgi:O-antigen/teichoic acid export membrane protein
MNQLSTLFIINISGKVVTLIVFAALARMISATHLAYVALIPALAPVILSLFGFGVNTLMERDVPRKLALNAESSYQLMRAGFLLNILSIILVVILGALFVGYWAPIVLGEYDYDITSIHWFLLPIATYMLLQITGLFLLLEGKAAQFGLLKVFGDIFAKTAVLVLYFLQPSEMAVIIGLTIGQLPFILYGLWLQRAWLLHKEYVPLRRVVSQALPFYLESNFNAARNQGDSLLVSTFLGPIAMAGYYVAKTVANQLSVFYNPIRSFMTHRLSFQKGHSEEAMNAAFKQVWHISVPVFIWLACAMSAVSPYLIQIVAGERYTSVWPVAILLCLLSCSLALYSLSGRILLLIGSAFERFRVTIIQTVLIVIFSVILVPILESEGIALSWLLAAVISLYIVKIRTIRLKFPWPKLKLFSWSILLTLSMPILSILLFSLELDPFLVITSFVLTAGLSLWAIFYVQDKYEETQMLLILPARIVPLYQRIRKS